MEKRIAVWESEGGALHEPPELTGTVKQIAWARQIQIELNAEVDRVAAALERVANGKDRPDIRTMLEVMEDKRADVMANREAGYFIHDWQEPRDKVRQLLLNDERYVKPARVRATRNGV